ncbi:hypothetical protein BG846_00271 [Streptomyces fradiae ATCC 10745 = DSM 40063]|uniref:Uncharacterized protein n=1 Tax=Streptomyces fradiae ATCC 10745 = DSM 40063 TaxID=1319510 RepID=A0A1Y2P2K2_STRFR|nr:hypothetical protein BG846_00271 [Streptomyces fradiae ATCC 10745 = DSM 40063]
MSDARNARPAPTGALSSPGSPSPSGPLLSSGSRPSSGSPSASGAPSVSGALSAPGFRSCPGPVSSPGFPPCASGTASTGLGGQPAHRADVVERDRPTGSNASGSAAPACATPVTGWRHGCSRPPSGRTRPRRPGAHGTSGTRAWPVPFLAVGLTVLGALGRARWQDVRYPRPGRRPGAAGRGVMARGRPRRRAGLAGGARSSGRDSLKVLNGGRIGAPQARTNENLARAGGVRPRRRAGTRCAGGTARGAAALTAPGAAGPVAGAHHGLAERRSTGGVPGGG